MTAYDGDDDVWDPAGSEADSRTGEVTGLSDEGGKEVSRERVDAEILVRRAIDVVSNAKAMPLSSSALISREEVLELLEDALGRFPDELRQARWLLRERDEFLARSRREGEEILDAARAQAARMVERTEIVRQAQATARRTIDDGNQEASRLRHEAEDFCDQKLAAFEIVLDRTTKTVNAGREKLRVTPAPLDSGLGDPYGADASAAGSERDGRSGRSVDDDERRGEVFFDQDVS